MITLGYKASAEQFAPVELLRFALAAEREGFDSVAISGSFPAVPAHGRPLSRRIAVAGRAGGGE